MQSGHRSSSSSRCYSPRDERSASTYRKSPNDSNKSSRSGSRSRSPVTKYARQYDTSYGYRRESESNRKFHGQRSFSNSRDQGLWRERRKSPVYSKIPEKSNYDNEDVYRNKRRHNTYDTEKRNGDKEYQPGKVPEGSSHCFSCGKRGHWKSECPENNGHREPEYNKEPRKFAYKSAMVEDQRFGRNVCALACANSYEREKNRMHRRPYDRQSSYQNEEGVRFRNYSSKGYLHDKLNGEKVKNKIENSCRAVYNARISRNNNARDETRSAIMAMMETMTSIPQRIEKHPGSIEAKLNTEHLDENRNLRDHTSEIKYSQKNLKFASSIVNDVLENVENIIFGKPDVETDLTTAKSLSETPISTSNHQQDAFVQNINTSANVGKPNKVTSKTYSVSPHHILIGTAKVEDPKHVNEAVKPTSTIHPDSPRNVGKPASNVVRLTPSASAVDHDSQLNVSRRTVPVVPNPRDPRKKSIGCMQENTVSSIIEKDNAHSNAMAPIAVVKPCKKNLKEQLIEQGVPEQTFDETDGFRKMWLTFSGRVHVVRKKPQEECNQIAKVMIACCQKTFDDYPTLAEHYIRARIDHINSALPDYFPEEKVSEDDMSTVPPLLEFRRRLHKTFYETLGKTAKLPFKYSELVDLSTYYFNHVASCKSWKDDMNL